MQCASKNRIARVIMTIDFEKCFDRIEHSAIHGALEYFGFGSQFTAWIMLLLKEFNLCTQNNGNISEWFMPSRGLRQGCCTTPFIYLLCGELLAPKIRENTDIKGINMYDVMALLSQFADDTTLFLSFDSVTLNAAIQMLTVTENNTGLKVNYNKTALYRIGSLANKQARLFTTEEFTWINANIKVLGVTIGNDTSQILSRNFNKILGKAEATLKLWCYGGLYLMGKILIINTLVGSLYVYKMSAMLNMPLNLIQEFNLLIQNFLWNRKRPKIPLSTL